MKMFITAIIEFVSLMAVLGAIFFVGFCTVRING